MRIPARTLGVILISCIVEAPAFAGFMSTEQYLAAVGRLSGAGGAEFYTTIWATNLTGAPVSFTFEFLKGGQANPSPASFADNLAAGETKVYENVVQTKLGLSGVLGGARVTSTGEILVAERIYNQAPGADLGDTEGLFFAGVPKSFSIALGQSASIQGINQGGAEDFRYNFALLETGGGSPMVNVQLFDGNGTMLGQHAYPMQPYEQIQPNVKDLFAGVATTNGRITATVTGGTGSIILAGAQLANVSQDSSGFEMSFRDTLLGGAAGVSSLNGLTGAVSITPGNGISVNASGSSIQVAYTGGGSSGLVAVSHDTTLTGDGTGASPLGVAIPFAATTTANATALQGNSTSNGIGVEGTSSLYYGVHGRSQMGYGIFGETSYQYAAGVGASSNYSGNAGYLAGGDYAVYGYSGTQNAIYGDAGGKNAAGVQGHSRTSGTDGYLGGPGYGLAGFGSGTGSSGVYGAGTNGALAGDFAGSVSINGTIHMSGIGLVTFDDPGDPANQAITHAFVGSSEMKNIYDGVATLGPTGAATVELPDWFETLNGDFRYQLTALGTPQAGLFVSREIENNRFTIAGGVPGARVSWQVTGVRRDPYASAHPVQVRERKAESQGGYYIVPELFGQPKTKSADPIARHLAAEEEESSER